MTGQKAYISGPITPILDFDREELKGRFRSAEKWLKEHWPGFDYVNPLYVQPGCEDLPCRYGPPTHGLDRHAWECYMRGDIKALTECDHIILLPGWELSRGAKVERDLALHLGLTPWFMEFNEENGWSLL